MSNNKSREGRVVIENWVSGSGVEVKRTREERQCSSCGAAIEWWTHSGRLPRFAEIGDGTPDFVWHSVRPYVWFLETAGEVALRCYGCLASDHTHPHPMHALHRALDEYDGACLKLQEWQSVLDSKLHDLARTPLLPRTEARTKLVDECERMTEEIDEGLEQKSAAQAELIDAMRSMLGLPYPPRPKRLPINDAGDRNDSEGAR